MPEQLELLPSPPRAEQLALDLWAPDMTRRQHHEPPSAVRYWARALALAVFYAFVVVGGIITVLFMLGAIRPGDLP